MKSNNNNNSKSVHKKRDRSTNAQKEFVKGIVHNLSLERLTDQEISDYLHNEKKIEIARSTITGIRNQIEKQAKKWYLELRQSSYKYIAVYKERLDSLLSYQKRLHEIISSTKKPEIQIRAIAELHSIEMSIFSLLNVIPFPEEPETETETAPVIAPLETKPYVEKYEWKERAEKLFGKSSQNE